MVTLGGVAGYLALTNRTDGGDGDGGGDDAFVLADNVSLAFDLVSIRDNYESLTVALILILILILESFKLDLFTITTPIQRNPRPSHLHPPRPFTPLPPHLCYPSPPYPSS